MNSFKKRLLAAIVMAPLTLVLLYLGAPFVNLFCMLCGTLLAWEWATFVPNRKNALYAAAYTSSVVMVSFLPGFYFILAMLVMLIITAVVWLKAKAEEHRWLLVLGVPYITLGIGSLNWFYELTNNVLLIWFVLVVWGVDVGGYLVGSTVKWPKLAPSISPNKTWSGLIGGVLLAGVVCGVFCYYMGLRHNPLWILTGGAMTLAVVAQIGDLFESAIKRRLGLKDSSNLIPGHGGVFDRIDGLLLAAPVLYLVIILL